MWCSGGRSGLSTSTGNMAPVSNGEPGTGSPGCGCSTSAPSCDSAGPDTAADEEDPTASKRIKQAWDIASRDQGLCNNGPSAAARQAEGGAREAHMPDRDSSCGPLLCSPGTLKAAKKSSQYAVKEGPFGASACSSLALTTLPVCDCVPKLVWSKAAPSKSTSTDA